MIKEWLLGHLYKAVTLKDLEESWNELPDWKKQQYKQEAKAIQSYEFNKWLGGEMEKVAMRKMYKESKNEQDMLFGKAGLHHEDVRKRKIQKILSL